MCVLEYVELQKLPGERFLSPPSSAVGTGPVRVGRVLTMQRGGESPDSGPEDLLANLFLSLPWVRHLVLLSIHFSLGKVEIAVPVLSFNMTL